MGYRNYNPNNGFLVAQNGTGDFTTIQTAITAAPSGTTIYIADGNYVENITLKAGVDLTSAVADAYEPNVSILGNLSFSAAGTASISNIKLNTNSGFFLSVTGSAASIVNLINCNLNCSNNTGINFSSSNAGAKIMINYCTGNIVTTGIALFASSSAGLIQFNYSFFTNTGLSSTANTASAGILSLIYSFFSNPVTTSSTATLTARAVFIDASGQNVTPLTHNGTGANSAVVYGFFLSGTASAVSIGTGATLIADNISVFSSNTNVVTGLGTLNYSIIQGQQNTGAINTSTVNTYRNFTGTLYSTGISFDSGTNTLANYATGTWTPTLVGTVTGVTTYTTQSGYYTRIGNMVTVWAVITITAATGTGTAIFGGLPFTIKNQASFTPTGGFIWSVGAGWTVPVGTTWLTTAGLLNTVTANVYGSGSGVGGGFLQMANAAATMEFSLTYQI